MFLDSRTHPRERRRVHGHGGRDYELLAQYAALAGAQGEQYGYARQARVQLDGVPLLRKRHDLRGDMLHGLGGGLLGMQPGDLGGMNGGFLGGHGGVGLGGGLGSLHGGIPGVPGGLGGGYGGIDFSGQTHGGQRPEIARLGGHRLPDLRSRMRAMRGATGIEFDGLHGGHHGQPSHGHHYQQNLFGGQQSGTGLEDRFSAMGLGDQRSSVHHQHGHVHPFPGHHGAHHHSAAQAEASHGGGDIGRGHGPNGTEHHTSRTPPGSHHSSRAGSVQGFDMYAMDRPRMPYHYRRPYVEESEGVSEADLQADLHRRAAMGELFPESEHWYDSSLMDLYYM